MQRFFGFIEAVADSIDQLVADKLGERTYTTATRGTRTVAPARALGQGTYSLVEHKGRGHVHLVYRLEVPAEPGTVQEDFEVLKEGSYVMQIKNPGNDPPQGPIGLEDKAEYSQGKQEEFQGYAWIPARDSGLLDYERCEFLLIGAADDLGQELGKS